MFNKPFLIVAGLIIKSSVAGASIHFSDWGGGGGKSKKNFKFLIENYACLVEVFLLNFMVL